MSIWESLLIFIREKISKTKTAQLERLDGQQQTFHLMTDADDKFVFENAPTKVEFVDCSVLKDKNLEEVYQIIRDVLKI